MNTNDQTIKSHTNENIIMSNKIKKAYVSLCMFNIIINSNVIKMKLECNSTQCNLIKVI